MINSCFLEFCKLLSIYKNNNYELLKRILYKIDRDFQNYKLINK